MNASLGDIDMNKSQEKLLVASLCGLIVVATAGFAVQPALADHEAAMSRQARVEAVLELPPGSYVVKMSAAQRGAAR